MKDFFFMGGPLFMGILSLLLIVMVSWIAYHFIGVLFSNNTNFEKVLRKISYGKSIGLFAMIFGILGQLIGLYQAFSVIEQAGSISPNLIYGGIKVSMIPTLYGIIIFLISLLLYFISSVIIEKNME
ncbi:MotA/TolQ/ExbB proton channel family protein [Marinifilum sp. RC60d5]|uniref:MotA/TolQ/ExbB proton channel family protein n=1 Tax=Marinifilum sp. RC60d5 TaxID=3458414 RepID=UPI00403571C7